MNKKQKKDARAHPDRCGDARSRCKLIPVTGVPQLALYLAAYLVIGYDILQKGVARAF